MMLLVGCGSNNPGDSSGSGTEKDSEQVLNTIYFKVATLDANDTTDNQSSTILNAVQEGLVRIENKGETEEIVAAGAESWETSEDGLTWTFKLRKMDWSDGEPVVAQHYVDSFQRILNPDNGFAYSFLAYDIVGAEEYNTGKGSLDAVGIKAVDDYTLEFKLKHPLPYFVSKVSYTVFHPIRLDVIEKLGDKYASEITDTVYNGPFKQITLKNGLKELMQENSKSLLEKIQDHSTYTLTKLVNQLMEY